MSSGATVHICLESQSLRVVSASGEQLSEYLISSAKNGAGELSGSEQTPRGRHVIRAKIGACLNAGSVMVGRRATGEIYNGDLASTFPERDWILSRILWLSGTELGKNRSGSRDSMRRYIYIHGTPDTEPMGVPLSHGCIRMRNEDVIHLFDQVTVGTVVQIAETGKILEKL